MAVGIGHPLLGNMNRKTRRAPVNPMDKSTIISIYPKPIHEENVTIEPGVFDIAAGKYDNPAFTTVEPASWWKEVDPEQPLLEIPISSIVVAEGIVTTWMNGLLGCDMAESRPGLIALPGLIDKAKLLKEFKPLLDKTAERQKRYFMNLVKIADTLWARTNGNPLVIGDEMKLAAQELGLKEKTWIRDFTTLELNNCPACGTLRNNTFPVCANCKTILDKKRFDELGLAIAK